MNISLSFASAGQIIVTGDQTYTLHLRGVVDFKPFDFTINYDSASVRDDKHEVVLKAINGNETYKFDIRDIDAGVTYATTADLMAAIQAQVAAMYAGGGGSVAWGDITGTLSSQADLNTALGLKAPLASPTFTGNPIVPTQSPATNNTRAASTAYADAAVAAAAVLGAAPLTRTGSAIAFDARAVYNSPDTPTSGAITVDLSGAVVNTQAVCYCNHAAEPTWPAGVTAVGVWDNSQLNVVTFTYTADGISAEIVSDAQGSYINPTVPYVLTSGNIVNTTTTPSVVTGISFNVLAGETYHIQGKVRCSGTAAGGVHFGFQGAGIASMEVNMFGTTTGATAFGTERVSSSGGMGTTDFAKYASTTNPWVQFDGFFVGGASDQVVDLIVASDLAAENATVYASNSILYVTLLT